MGNESLPDDASLGDIQRAWVKPRPPPLDAPRGYVRSIYRWQRTNWRVMKIIMVLWFVVVGLITLSAAVDVVAGLGWGYRARDIGGGVLMLALGGLAVPVFRAINSLVVAITRTIYGPTPGADET